MSRGFHRFAHLPPAWKVTCVRKACALRRFDRLDAAQVFPFEKEAFTVRLVDDAQTGAIGVQSRAGCGESLLFHPKKGCDACHLFIRHAHVPGPAAAVATALAEVARCGV